MMIAIGGLLFSIACLLLLICLQVGKIISLLEGEKTVADDPSAR